MKNRKKRGFTIVELVIVIAVIAILAAVLIPTFSGVVQKANDSADMQLIRQANLILELEAVDGVIPENETKAKELLEKNGVVLGSPMNEDSKFFYIKDKNLMVIWDFSKNKLTFPEVDGLETWQPDVFFKIGDTYYKTLGEAVAAAQDGDTVTMLQDYKTSTQVTVNKQITLDLNGYEYLISGMNINTEDFGCLKLTASCSIKNGLIKTLNDNTISERWYVIHTTPGKSDIQFADLSFELATANQLRGVLGISSYSTAMIDNVHFKQGDYAALFIDNWKQNETSKITIAGNCQFNNKIISNCGNNAQFELVIDSSNCNITSFGFHSTRGKCTIKTHDGQKLVGMDKFTKQTDANGDAFFTYQGQNQ